MKQADPHVILGIGPDAGEEEIRAAYLRKVKEYPPDRAPQEFEKIRDAYEAARDPRRRVNRLLEANPQQRFTELVKSRPPARRFVGPEPWLDVLKERKS